MSLSEAFVRWHAHSKSLIDSPGKYGGTWHTHPKRLIDSPGKKYSIMHSALISLIIFKNIENNGICWNILSPENILESPGNRAISVGKFSLGNLGV